MHRAHHRHTVLDLCKATVYSLLTFLPTLPKLCSQFACHKIVKKKKTTEQKNTSATHLHTSTPTPTHAHPSHMPHAHRRHSQLLPTSPFGRR